MKKIFICIVALCAVFKLSAQNKADMYIGGHVGVATTAIISGEESAAAIKFIVAPEFGYFVTDRFKIGASLAYGIESETHILEVMPNIEYYAKICDGFYYTPGLQLGFVAGFSEGMAMPGFGLNLSLGGFEFRPTQKFGLSVELLSLSYVYMKYQDYGYGFSTSGIGFALGINPSVGFKYYF